MITWTSKRRDEFTAEEWNKGLLEHIKAEYAPTQVRSMHIAFEDYEGGIDDFIMACINADMKYGWRADGSFEVRWEA